MFELPELKAIGEKYGKTVAQIILRWHLQRGVVVIPKSTHTDPNMVEWFVNACKLPLDKLVLKLQNKGFDSTPYNDKD